MNTNHKNRNMSKAPAPVNPIGNRPNKDGCYTMTVRDPKQVVFFLTNGTYTACIGHRKSEKGTEYFYPYIRDTYSGRDVILQKVYVEDIIPDSDFSGKEILKFSPLTRTGAENQSEWVKIYDFFVAELARIKAPQLVGKTVKKYIHEGEEKIKLASNASMEEILKRNHKDAESVPIEGAKWTSTLLSVYCMSTEEGEMAMGVCLYVGYPFYETREAFLKANPGHARKRARVSKEEEEEKKESSEEMEVAK
jgi:hypothetical protein